MVRVITKSLLYGNLNKPPLISNCRKTIHKVSLQWKNQLLEKIEISTRNV